MEKAIESLEELQNEAARFVVSLAPSSQRATLVTLSGELGAGKTAFTKAVAKVLGVEEIITSPTFVLEKMYPLSKGKIFKRLVHIDVYRLEKGSDLTPLCFDELMRDPGNLILLEWPERVVDELPAPTERISFIVNTDGSRTLSYD